MPKIVNTALKAKAIKFGLEAPRGQGLALEDYITALLQ